jgi:uncharacterized delta-60 repeat protein
MSRRFFLAVSVLLVSSFSTIGFPGDLDPTFNSSETNRIPFGIHWSANVRDMAIQPDGKIIVVGNSSEISPITGAFMRFASDGQLDPTFGDNGKVLLENHHFKTVAVLPNGKILAAGSNGDQQMLIRFNADGSLDHAFDGDGIVTLTAFAPRRLLVQADGRILIAGTSPVAQNDFDFAVVRFTSDGLPDTSFGNDGRQTISFGNRDEMPLAISLQRDGKIVLTGYTRNPNAYPNDIHRGAVARFTPDGQVDTSFGVAGKVVSDFKDGAGAYLATGVQADGKIVAAGQFRPTGANAVHSVIVRFSEDGSLDHSFGIGGRTLVGVDAQYDSLQAIVIQPNGKIIGVGYAGSSPGNTFTAMRFNPDGTLDTAGFGTKGIVQGSFMGYLSGGRSVAVDSYGRIVIAGVADRGFGVARLLGDAAASFTITGRVLETTGRPISKARVTIVDSLGEYRTALSNPFGYYRFFEVPGGATHVSVSAKRYSFSPVQLDLTSTLFDLDIIANP